MDRLTPCLLFATEAEAAAQFYVTLLPDSDIAHVQRNVVDSPGGPAGSPLMVSFTLAGRPFLALNCGAATERTHSFSFSVACADQAEIDRLWAVLTEGGKPAVCGWLTDRHGYSWQIFPERLPAMLADPDPQKAARALQAMMGMVKLDIAALQLAYDGA